MKKFRIALTCGLVVAGLLSLSGCSMRSTNTANFYFVIDTPRGLKIVSENREYKNLEQAVGGLISGDLQPIDPDYVNLWQGNSSLNEIKIIDNLAVVDLQLNSLNVGAEGEQRAIDQIVWTITEIAPEVKFVEFLVNANPIQSLAGHVNTLARFTRQPAYEVLNPLQITSINDAATVTSPVVILGEACTFEANVVWTLVKEDQLIESSFTTAETACPERSNFSIELGELSEGTYQIKVEEYSAEDGSLFAIDNKTFSVK
jgi:hypothetical protein